jgi:hypothetical protein
MAQVHTQIAMVHWLNNDWSRNLAGLNSSAWPTLACPNSSTVGLMAGLTMGLKAMGVAAMDNSSAWLILAFLTAMDGSNDSSCCDDWTDGSSNGLKATDGYREKVLGLVAMA